jgi:RimJ/RimL family protein N-acetyltransferase
VLRGEKVALRAIERADLETLVAWDQEYETWPQISYAPYAPRSLADVLREYDDGSADSGYRRSDTSVPFAVVAEDVLVGSITLWGIDAHNRRAHLGVGLGAPYRGRGFGADACRVLLRYAFVDRGLHRVQLEVLADNEPALRAYQAAGFVEDGRMREAAWVDGRFVDEVYMSVLAAQAGT